MKQLCYLVLFWGILQSSCSKAPTENEENNIPSEDTGVLLLHYGLNIHWVTIVWSRNTKELFIAGSKGIQVIDLSTLSVRTIEGKNGVSNTFRNSMALSNDGNILYYFLTGSSWHGPLYRISIDGHNRQLLNDSECSDLCLSPDDSRLAYCAYHPFSEGGADSLYIFKIDSKEKNFLCIGHPITFSPDSRSLLYYYLTHPDTSQYAVKNYSIVSIDNGETYPVSTGIDIHSIRLYSFFWDENGIYVLYTPEYGQCAVRNITTNETIFSWKAHPYVYSPSYTFSPQGKKIAFWISFEGIKPGIAGYSIHVIDLSLKSDTRIAYSVREGQSHSIAFSQDESKIAYAFGESIYMKDIP